MITDGFYDWCKSDNQPFAIGFKENHTILAGLRETRTGPSDTINSCMIIIITDADEAVSAVHDRIAVILAEKYWPHG